MLECLVLGSMTRIYKGCGEAWGLEFSDVLHDKIMAELRAPSEAECKFVWDWRYNPEKVPPKLVNPDAIEPDDIIDAMIGLPAPPPGWNLPDLVPLLCPLGAGPGWGCPGTPTDPTGSQPGDHP